MNSTDSSRGLLVPSIGQHVTIRGRDGAITVMPDSFQIKTGRRSVSANESVFEIVQAPLRYGEHHVAFRYVGLPTSPLPLQESYYLTVCPCTEEARTAIEDALAAYSPFLPVHVPLIVEFLVDKTTAVDNFEGKGFNYSPMTMERGVGEEPNMMQVFELEPVRFTAGTPYGIKSVFGTYWRSQHWDHIVSQSSHCLEDEQWHLRPTNGP